MNFQSKKPFLALLILSLGLVLYLENPFLTRPAEIGTEPLTPQSSEPVLDKLPEEKPITLLLVGDIMLDRGVEYIMEKEGDWRFPFLKIAENLKGVDVLFGNLEGPISNKGEKVGSIYSFRANPEVIQGLSFAGFDVLSIANNHAFDYGREALEDTFFRLKEAGIDYVGGGFNGGEAYSPIIKEVNGTKIAFLAYTNLGPESWKAVEENSGIAWISENDFEKIKNDIKEAREKTDVLIVSLHAGEEYFLEPTQFQIQFSRAAIEAGANVVVGHHSHVVQGNEKHKEGWIFYSLGNFVFDQGFSEETMKGQAVKVLIENGKIRTAAPMEIEINSYFQPDYSQLSIEYTDEKI